MVILTIFASVSIVLWRREFSEECTLPFSVLSKLHFKDRIEGEIDYGRDDSLGKEKKKMRHSLDLCR